MEAPAVAYAAEDTASPVTALAQAQTNEKPAKSPRTQVRKQIRVTPRENDERALGYAQQWNGYGDWNGNRPWHAGRKLTGDPRLLIPAQAARHNEMMSPTATE
jgi:hypothetical protein